MSEFIGVVTTIGQSKIAASIGGTALNLTTVRVGDGNGAAITPAPGMTDLVRRVGTAYPIISSGRDPLDATKWVVTTLIPEAAGPFDIREIGVFDSAGDMIAIAKHPWVEKRTPAQGLAMDLTIDVIFPVSETAQVTVTISPAVQVSLFQQLRAGFMVVESATVTAPPATPALGRTHVVPAGATGAWSGLSGLLVQWDGSSWVSVDAPIGFHVVDQSKGRFTGKRWLERTATGWSPGISAYVQKRPGNFIATGGSANALTATLDPVPEPDVVAQGFDFLVYVGTVNTSSAVNIVVNGADPVPIVKRDGSLPEPGDITGYLRLVNDGMKYRVQGPVLSDAPKLATGDITLYVRPDGADTNDGSANSAAKAFQTIAAAIGAGLKRYFFAGFALTIQLGIAGSYAPPGLVAGATTINIVGNPAAQSTYSISGAGPAGGGSGLVLSQAAQLNCIGVKIENTGTINHSSGAITGGRISFTNVTFAKTGGATAQSILTAIGGIVTINAGCVIDGGVYGTAINAANGAQIGIAGNMTVSGTPAFNVAFLQMNSCATLGVFSGATISGAATGTRYTVSTNAVCTVNGAGGNYFPGSGAGATASGGQYL